MNFISAVTNPPHDGQKVLVKFVDTCAKQYGFGYAVCIYNHRLFYLVAAHQIDGVYLEKFTIFEVAGWTPLEELDTIGVKYEVY